MMKKRIKNIMYKLHLYLGLTAALVVSLVGITGAILSYEKELLKIFNPDAFEVKVEEKKLPIQTLVSKFLEQKPEAKIRMITTYSEVGRSYIFRIASKENRKGKKIYVDPYTAEILPDVSGGKFFHLVEKIHRRLLLGEIGKQIVGASVLMLIVIIISGIYIYMPKIRHGFLSSFTFNPKMKGRAFLYSLHGALGMWVIPFYLVVSLSGLYWSYKWYNNALHTITGVEKTKKHMHKKPEKKSSETTRQTKKHADNRKNKAQNNIAVSIDEAFDSFHFFVGHGYSNTTLFTNAKKGIYRFVYVDKDPSHIYARNTLEVNSKTKQLIKHERYNDKTAGGQLMGSIFALHSGVYFGWIGQLGMFLAALLMPLFGITGLMLYLKKRKSKK